MRAAREVLDALAAAGIRVWVEDGRLLYKAAPGTLTEDLKTRIRPVRGDIIAILSGAVPTESWVKKSQGGSSDAPWHPETQKVENPAEHVKALRRFHELPAFGQLMEAIAAAWARTKPQEKDDEGRKTPIGRSLRREYERLAGWATFAPEVVTADWLAEQVARYAVPPPTQSFPPVLGWPEGVAELVAWADGLEADDLPPAPFALRPGIKVSASALWLASLREDIAAGPRGPRARTGALQDDLRALREAIAALPAPTPTFHIIDGRRTA